MLIQFNFKNYKSFRDETSLDLSATKMKEFESSVVTIGGEKILPVAAVYGANASGKSNVYSAFEFMTAYVENSFFYGDDDKTFADARPTPFLFDSRARNAESMFEVYFTIPGESAEKTYNYGFCIDETGITEEWLNTKAKSAREFKSVFYRNTEKQELDLRGIAKVSRDNIEVALNRQVLIISLGAKLKVEKCKQIRDWFLLNEFADFGNEMTNLFLSRTLPKGFVEDEKVREDVLKYFSSFDKQITGFKIEELPSKDEQKEKKYAIDAIHRMIDSEDDTELPLHQESAGTLKMFAMYPALHEVLEKGGVLCIDELNSRLHPLLVRNFILTFLNPEINKNHAQLIFTTHDTWQLSNQLLRRDEIWFTEKDEKGLSNLYSLADFVDEDGSRIRKDENYEKNYLLGKYGAIPSLETIRLLEEE
mgnify:FL=1